MSWYRLSSNMVPVKSRISRKSNLLNDDSEDVSGGMSVAATVLVLALEAKSRRRERSVLDVAKLTRAAVEAVEKERWPVVVASRPWQQDVSPLAATLGPSGGAAAGRMESGLPNVLISFLK